MILIPSPKCVCTALQPGRQASGQRWFNVAGLWFISALPLFPSFRWRLPFDAPPFHFFVTHTDGCLPPLPVVPASVAYEGAFLPVCGAFLPATPLPFPCLTRGNVFYLHVDNPPSIVAIESDIFITCQSLTSIEFACLTFASSVASSDAT
jgi:hypothetical protein